MLDQAFEALKTYDWGVDPKVLRPIDDAVVSTGGDAPARAELEGRLVAALGTPDLPQAAVDAICRALKTVGTAASVPALAGLLADTKLSHLARYALQSIPGREAAQALLGALPAAPAEIKIGIASSLGARGENLPAAPFAAMLADEDPAVARSGALALGALGTPEAAAALASARAASDDATQTAIADSLLQCAENLLAAGRKAEARAVYKKILASNPTEAASVAASLGVAASS